MSAESRPEPRYDIGAIAIAKVVEEVSQTSPRFLFANAGYAQLEPHHHWLQPHFVHPNGRLMMSIHSFVVRTKRYTILVDTCLGNDKQNRHYEPWNHRNSDFLARLHAAGVSEESVDFVFCTHLHVDHVGWNTKLENGRWVPTFPNATYLFNRSEHDYWAQVTDKQDQAVYADSVLPVVEAGRAQFVDAGHEIDHGLILESTPGHTPGHCSLQIESDGQRGVITGDMIHHPVQIAENHFSSLFDVDPARAAQTREAFCARYSDRDVRILGTHFAPPTAGRIIDRGGQCFLEV